jgi:hypothetical protein
MSKLSLTQTNAFVGSTEIKPLLYWMTGGDYVWSNTLWVMLVTSAHHYYGVRICTQTTS